MPKAGWTIEIRRGDDGVNQVSWRADSREAWIDDAWYDEFVLRLQLPQQPGALWFKVLQQCETGQADWAQVPESGTSTKGLTAPAALLELLPAEPQAGHAH